MSRTFLSSLLILPGTAAVLIPALLVWAFGGPGERLEPHWLHAASIAAGGAAGLAGAALAVWTFRLFMSADPKGTIAPWRPINRLVVKGPYRHVRNPMISGVLLILIGEALMLRSLPVLAWAGVFYAANTLWFALWEEPDLHRRFGADYAAYSSAVRRWLPRVRPYRATPRSH